MYGMGFYSKRRIPVITIDGPGGVGKGTICQTLAKRLRWNFLYSGIIYRILAFYALYNKISVSICTEERLISVAQHLDINSIITKGVYDIILKGKNISNIIYMEKIGTIASKIAQLPRVRKALLCQLRACRKLPGLIAEGRDMGTVVFPDAHLKFFLDASIEERARRRMLQLQRNGFSVNFEQLVYDIKRRDERDRNRIIAPLKPADDAIILDSTSMDIQQVIEQVYHRIYIHK